MLKNKKNKFRNAYRNKIREKKIKYNEELISNASNKTRAMWQVINQHNPRNGKEKHADCDILCDIFNKYFSTIASNLISELPSSCKNAILLCNSNSNLINNNLYFKFTEVSSERVREVIANLKNSNSFDIYGLNVKIIKSVKSVILSPLTKLINKCITESIYPNCVKEAVVNLTPGHLTDYLYVTVSRKVPYWVLFYSWYM